VPVGYIWSTVFVAVCALLALTPVRRPRPLASLSFHLGLVINEVPFTGFLWLHGGGYNGGRKNSQSLPLLYRLASQGWVCVSANYRLRPAARHPDHLIDLKRVIAWVHEHGHEYGADPATLFVSGSSAGGQHAFDLFHSFRFEAVVDAIEAFAAWVRSREKVDQA
jgi:acetyl esterase/lipase